MLLEDYKILIVDDDVKQLGYYMTLFKKNAPNCKLLTIPEGTKAVAIAAKERPDLIILDWQMPDMDGMDVFRLLKSNNQTDHIPVMLITGLTHNYDLEYAFDMGIEEYIAKPFNDSELFLRIKIIMKRKRLIKQLNDEILTLKRYNL